MKSGLTDFIQVKVSSVNEPVNDRQKKIIELLTKNNFLTIQELREQLNAGRETVKRDLKKLRDLNLIKRIGPDKTGYWQVINRNIP